MCRRNPEQEAPLSRDDRFIRRGGTLVSPVPTEFAGTGGYPVACISFFYGNSGIRPRIRAGCRDRGYYNWFSHKHQPQKIY
jgi:hypothetical protein